MNTEPMKHWVLFLNNTNPHLNHRNSFSIKEHWVEIYSHQKAINYISPSNLRASVETHPPKLPNVLQFSSPSIPDILWASPSSFARFCDTRISSIFTHKNVDK